MDKTEARWLHIMESELKKEMDKAPSPVPSHDINHIRRVWNNVKKISEGMDADFEILMAAAFFHDIGRHYPEGVREHGPISAPFAKKVLERIDFPKEKIEYALSAIRYHDESFPPEKRPAKESKILYDADKLDAFGAIGISRFLVFNALRGKTLKETVEYALENLPLRFKGLELEKTKKIAKPGYDYSLDYFKRLKEEM